MNRITAVVLSLIIGLSACACADKETTKQETSIKAGSTYEMSLPPTQHFVSNNHASYSSVFFYMHSTDYISDELIYEYDTESGKTAEIKIKADQHTHLSNIISHGGKLYASEVHAEDSGAVQYYLTECDYNSGSSERIYTAKGEIIQLGFYNDSDTAFFIETDGKTDKSNHLTQGMLTKFDLSANKAEQLFETQQYYIDSNKIYFTKYNEKKHCLELYSCPVDDTSDVTELGLIVNTQTEISENNITSFDMSDCMFQASGDKIYYTNNENKLLCYDIKAKKTKTAAELSEGAMIRFFGQYNGKWYILSRELKQRGAQYCLYSTDSKGEPELILSDDILNQSYLFDYEFIDSIALFDDLAMVVTYNGDMGLSYYRLNDDDSTKLIKRLGNWDYEAYEEMELEIERILQDDPAREYLKEQRH